MKAYQTSENLATEARELLREARERYGKGVSLARKGFDVEACGERIRVTIWIYNPMPGLVEPYVGLI